MDADNQSTTGAGAGTAQVTESKRLYAVEPSEGTLQFGYWDTPPPGATVITTREELFAACANYTKSDVLEALVGLLRI